MDNQHLRQATRFAEEYLQSLDERPVAPTPEALQAMKHLAGPLGEDPVDPDTVLELLHTYGSPATMASAGSRFFGFVIGGSLPAALAANWLAGAWDQNAGLDKTSPIASFLEEVCSRWLVELLPVAPEAKAGFTTGVTMANMSGIAAARHALLARQGWDIEGKGLYGAPELKVVVGAEAHNTVLKALSILGLGRDRVIRVPVDAQGRMLEYAFPEVDEHTIVCLQAGNVDTGSFDPPSLVAQAKKQGAWVHVDGAFGLWAGTAPDRAHLTAGIEHADSWATDGHKWLNVPYDSGIVLVRDASQLTAAMAMQGAYLDQSGSRIPYHFTPELSRRARGVEVWAALKSLGRSGVADMVERCCQHATRFATLLSDAGYEILNDVVLNQVLVSFGSDTQTDRVISGIQKDGTCWCGGTTWQGRRAMRISVCNWSTSAKDVERSATAMIRVAQQTNRN